MVMGQRRIGKTSLLKEVVATYPPGGYGRVTAAFFDISSLHLPPEPGSMPRAFFDHVVSKLCFEELNVPIRQALRCPPGREEETIRRLTRGLRPETSLEDSLEGLVQRIGESSEARIGRMVFLIDEFDRFVEPLLAARRSEVYKLHAALRQIVQRSRRLVFILAGSGLQRLFTGDLDNPLYGSIRECELLPFDPTRDREAIEATLMPRSVRSRVCPRGFPGVVNRAHELTGGHPYFLSMLGRAVAQAWRGSLLTPETVNRVVERMLQPGAGQGGEFVSAAVFYEEPVFKSLMRLPPRTQAVAKLMLVAIARLTSTYQQGWTRWRLVSDQFCEDPELAVLVHQEERTEALSYLKSERVIELQQGGEVRIRVPLIAAAIRENAQVIKEEAITQLG
jgi:hypothetical protein